MPTPSQYAAGPPATAFKSFLFEKHLKGRPTVTQIKVVDKGQATPWSSLTPLHCPSGNFQAQTLAYCKLRDRGSDP